MYFGLHICRNKFSKEKQQLTEGKALIVKWPLNKVSSNSAIFTDLEETESKG